MSEQASGWNTAEAPSDPYYMHAIQIFESL